MTTTTFGGGPSLEARKNFANLKPGSQVPGYVIWFCIEHKKRFDCLQALILIWFDVLHSKLWWLYSPAEVHEWTHVWRSHALASQQVRVQPLEDVRRRLEHVWSLEEVQREERAAQDDRRQPFDREDDPRLQRLVHTTTAIFFLLAQNNKKRIEYIKGYIPSRKFEFADTYKVECDYCIDNFIGSKQEKLNKNSNLMNTVSSQPRMNTIASSDEVRNVLDNFVNTHPQSFNTKSMINKSTSSKWLLFVLPIFHLSTKRRQARVHWATHVRIYWLYSSHCTHHARSRRLLYRYDSKGPHSLQKRVHQEQHVPQQVVRHKESNHCLVRCLVFFIDTQLLKLNGVNLHKSSNNTHV